MTGRSYSQGTGRRYSLSADMSVTCRHDAVPGCLDCIRVAVESGAPTCIVCTREVAADDTLCLSCEIDGWWRLPGDPGVLRRCPACAAYAAGEALSEAEERAAVADDSLCSTCFRLRGLYRS